MSRKPSLPQSPTPSPDRRLLSGWHTDYPGHSEVELPRIKSMIYLTETTEELGAIRLLPGTHTAEAQRWLRRIQAFHGIVTASQRWIDGVGLGLSGEQLPARAVEITPGDQVGHTVPCTFPRKIFIRSARAVC